MGVLKENVEGSTAEARDELGSESDIVLCTMSGGMGAVQGGRWRDRDGGGKSNSAVDYTEQLRGE